MKISVKKAGSPSVGWVLASLALCMLLPSLGTSIANVALPTLAAAFGASFQQAQWVVLAYLLATTALIVSAGRLGDIVGRRRLLMVGIGLFTVGSALCATAPGLGWLIAARGVQGVGAAIMLALTMALVGEAVPTSHTGRAMGLLGTMSAVGTALGPSLGGGLVHQFGWPSIFWVSVPLGGLALVLARRCLPADRQTLKADQARFDHLGTLLLAFTLVAYALAMTVGRGHFGPLNMALLLTTLGGLGLFVWAQAHAHSPLIRLEKFRDRALSTSLAMSALVATVMMATLVVGPFYLAHALGLGTALVGVILSVGPVVAAFTGVPAGRAVDRFGPHRTSLGGLTGMVLGCLALGLAPAALGIAGYVIPIALITASYALFQAANNTAVMAEVLPEERGVVSGLLNLSRNLGLITGASVMGAVFATASGTVDFSTAHPDAVAIGMRVTFAVAAALVAVALAIALGRSSVTSSQQRLTKAASMPHQSGPP